MAYVYLASIKSSNEWQAKFLAEKYHGQTFTFNAPGNTLSVVPTRLVAGAAFDQQNPAEWWTHVYCLDVTDSGVSDEYEAQKANEFANIIYGMLRNERHFDFATVGCECGEFRSEAELLEDFHSGFYKKLDGLVVKNGWKGFNLATSDAFQPFSPTHHWIPKKPEVYPRNQPKTDQETTGHDAAEEGPPPA